MKIMDQRPTSGHPAGLWISGWRLVPPASPGGTGPERAIGLRTMNEPGSVGPVRTPATWSFHLERPEELAAPAVRLYAFGFQLDFALEPVASALVFSPEPGVLCGQVPAQIRPALFCAEREIQIAEQTSWLHTDRDYILLLKATHGTDTRFCLVVREAGDEAGAVDRACHFLGQNVPQLFEDECRRRAAFWAAVHNGEGPKDLAARALETLFAHLRPPEGALPFRWSLASLEEPPRFDLNQLWPLVLAWQIVDPAVAADLVKAALSCQGPNGFLPAQIAPDEPGTGTAALPLIAQAAERAAAARPEPGYLDYVLPRLRAYLTWALRHYQPEGTELPCWTCAEEALIPETYDHNLASADLTTFLLLEIAAYRRLAQASFAAADDAFWLAQERRLAGLLHNVFWENERQCFPDRYRQGTAIERVTLSAILPLLWPGVRPFQRQGALQWLKRPDGFESMPGIPAWIRWDTDTEEPPVRALHQFLVLQALRQVGARNELQTWCQDLTELLYQQMKENGGLSDPLSPGPSRVPPQAAPSAAALTIFLRTAASREVLTAKPAAPIWQWADRHHRLLFLLPTSLLVGGWLALALAFLFKTRPPQTAIETWASLAQRHYREGRYADAQALFEQVLSRSPGIVPVELFLANALLKQGDLVAAEDHYRRLISRAADNPVPYLNLAVTFYCQGRTNEAVRGFREFIEKFGAQYPELAARAREALILLAPAEPAGSPPPPATKK